MFGKAQLWRMAPSVKSKERVKGQLSKQWGELGVEKRPMSGVSSSGAW